MSPFNFINTGVRPGHLFTVVRVNEDASLHGYTTELFQRPPVWVEGAIVQLLDWQPHTLSTCGRCRFSISGKTWAGKAHALRLIVQRVAQ
jgi:hypothetical protein